MERGVPGLKHRNEPERTRTMTDLPAFADVASSDQGLVVFTTLRRDGSAQASVVNAGVLPHPLTNEPVVGLVAIGSARKLGHLRADPRTTVTARAGWLWATVEGSAQLIGPDDPHPDVDDERLRVILREIFTAAGGTHDDWDTYDRVMREERRTAVLISPDRVYTNPARG
jgi:PPOX class probable F420-dependent enzyme